MINRLDASAAVILSHGKHNFPHATLSLFVSGVQYQSHVQNPFLRFSVYQSMSDLNGALFQEVLTMNSNVY